MDRTWTSGWRPRPASGSSARARADRTIDTSGPIEGVQAAVEEALASALAGKLDILPFGSVQR